MLLLPGIILLSDAFVKPSVIVSSTICIFVRRVLRRLAARITRQPNNLFMNTRNAVSARSAGVFTIRRNRKHFVIGERFLESSGNLYSPLFLEAVSVNCFQNYQSNREIYRAILIAVVSLVIFTLPRVRFGFYRMSVYFSKSKFSIYD